MLISQMDGYFENNPHCLFLEDPMLFLLVLKKKKNSKKKCFREPF